MIDLLLGVTLAAATILPDPLEQCRAVDATRCVVVRNAFGSWASMRPSCQDIARVDAFVSRAIRLRAGQVSLGRWPVA